MLNKENLLASKLFIQNEYLEAYLLLIENNYQTKYIKHKTAKHHIIPRSYYKLLNIPVDNSNTNLVNLSHYDHLLAHYYLALCATGKLKTKMLTAFMLMCNEDFKRYKISTEIIEHFTELSNLKEEYCILQSFQNKGRKMSKEAIQKARNTFKSHYNCNGPSQLPGVGAKISASKKGVCTMTEKQRQIIIEANKRNNTGVPRSEVTKQKISQSLIRHKGANVGRKCINKDGVNKYVPLSELDKYIADGWSKGKYKI